MKKILSVLAVSFMFLAATTAFAQDCKKECKKAPHGKELVQNLKKDLNLSDKQVAEVSALFADMDSKKICNDGVEKKMQEILTPEQFAKFQESSKACPAHKEKDGKCAKKEGCKKECAKKEGCKKECAKKEGCKKECAKKDGCKKECAKKEGCKKECAKKEGCKKECTKK